MREFINQKKTNNSRRIKRALTIKNLGVEVSPEETRNNSENYVYLKSPTVQMPIKLYG